MLDWLSPMVSGAVVHSNFWASRLARDLSSARSWFSRSPCPDDHMPAPPQPRDDRLVVASIGYVNPNRQVEQVLYALASHGELRRRCELEVDRARYLEASARRSKASALDLGLHKPGFTGWVEDAELRRLMASVDVLCRLRHPILETGSASLITGMRSARPVLVSAHGAYADVPDDLVLSLHPAVRSTRRRPAPAGDHERPRGGCSQGCERAATRSK